MDQDHVIRWLLEDDNPPVQYLTLTRLLKQPGTDAEVQRAKARLMQYPVTEGILAHGPEFWPAGDRAYAKYTGKYWQTIFLGQFLADGHAPRIAEGVRGLLADHKWVTASGGQCLTANMLAAFRRLGYGDHPVVVEETEALAKRFLDDGGIRCSVMAYSLLSHCYMALPKLLLCFGEVPRAERSPAIRDAIEHIVTTLLAREVYVYVPAHRRSWQKVLAQAPKRADLPPGHTVKGWLADRREAFLAEQGLGGREPKRGWTKFGFPRHYNSDILEAMVALAFVGAPMTPELSRPLGTIQDKRTPDGTWIMENSLNGKMWVDVEAKARPSKWITYFCLYVLDHFKPDPPAAT
jgi:hypothetical protein